VVVVNVIMPPSGRRSPLARVVLDIQVQSNRDAGAAKRFFKHLLRGLQYVLVKRET
jgi:hypothetical protein